MSNFLVALIGTLALARIGQAGEADSVETFQLTEPRTQVRLELHADGTAAFSRQFRDESGEVSVYRSSSGTWTRCGNGSERLSRIKPILESTNCFIVNVDGADEQGEARLGMMFTRDGDMLKQVLDTGPALVLQRTQARPAE